MPARVTMLLFLFMALLAPFTLAENVFLEDNSAIIGREGGSFTSVLKRLNFSINPRKLSIFYRSFSNQSRGGGGKTKEFSRKNIGVKVVKQD